MHPLIMDLLVTERINRRHEAAQAVRVARSARLAGGAQRAAATHRRGREQCIGRVTSSHTARRRTSEGLVGVSPLVIGGMVPFGCVVYGIARTGGPEQCAILMVALLAARS